MKRLEDSIRLALDRGHKNWTDYISNLDDTAVKRFYCSLYNRRFGGNYTNEYILRGRSAEDIREELMNMNHSEEAARKLARAILDYEEQSSNYNYSFSYITRIGYPDDTLFDPPSLDWLESIDGYSWACYHL